VLIVTVCAEVYVPATGLKVGTATMETVTLAEPVTPPLAAITDAVPWDIVDTSPAELGFITAGLLEDQFTEFVTSVVLESL
jgi:hypothetical protein